MDKRKCGYSSASWKGTYLRGKTRPLDIIREYNIEPWSTKPWEWFSMKDKWRGDKLLLDKGMLNMHFPNHYRLGEIMTCENLFIKIKWQGHYT